MQSKFDYYYFNAADFIKNYCNSIIVDSCNVIQSNIITHLCQPHIAMFHCKTIHSKCESELAS